MVIQNAAIASNSRDLPLQRLLKPLADIQASEMSMLLAERAVPAGLCSCGITLPCARLHTMLQGASQGHHGHTSG